MQLIDLSNSVQIWCDAQHFKYEPTRMIRYQEQVAQVITAKIASEYGIIYRTLSPDSKNKPPSELKTYEAILRYHEFQSNFTAETFY
ncbi:hypothetical protein QUF75_12320 [Desulfococcaceae bacterium HSG7]|nr:hypothetical protein [Desulfococcaceae bacterium HSG7]